MKFTDIFINKPVLAVVVSLFILLFGLRAYSELNVRQYPELRNAVVNVSTTYFGADADLIDFALKGTITGRPRLLGGTGNDELKIAVDGPRSADPFIDGGPGFDKAFGWGTIINVEDISQ